MTVGAFGMFTTTGSGAHPRKRNARRATRTNLIALSLTGIVYGSREKGSTEERPELPRDTEVASVFPSGTHSGGPPQVRVEDSLIRHRVPVETYPDSDGTLLGRRVVQDLRVEEMASERALPPIKRVLEAFTGIGDVIFHRAALARGVGTLKDD
jgi:hypothetical protein